MYHLTARDHITDTLISLHWLRAPQRILYKMAVMTYKALLTTLPQFVGLSRSAVSNRLRIPPSAVERFPSQQHSSETGCPTMLRQPILCRLCGTS